MLEGSLPAPKGTTRSRLQFGPAVAEPRAVGDRGETPLALEERPAALVGEAMIVESHHHPCLTMLGIGAAQRRRHRPPGHDTVGVADRQLIAGDQGSAPQPAKRPERVGGAAAEGHRHVEAAADRQVGPRPRTQEVERQHITRLGTEGLPGRAGIAVQPGWQIGARDRHGGRPVEAQLGPHVRAFQHGGVIAVADQEVCGQRRVLVERSRRRDAHVVVPGPARVLDGRGEAGLQNANSHGGPPPDRGCSRRDRPGTGPARTPPAPA